MLSSSLVIAVLALAPTAAAGAGAQVVFGVEYELSQRVRVGIGIQGMFAGKRSLQLATEDGFKFCHGGGLLTVSYDRR